MRDRTNYVRCLHDRHRKIRQRANGDDVRANALDGLDQQIDAVQRTDRHRLIRVDDALSLVSQPQEIALPQDGLADAGSDRRMRFAAELQELLRNARAQLRIAGYGGDRMQLQLRSGHQQRQGNRVVDIGPDVGIQKDRKPHTRTLSRGAPGGE